MIARFTMARIWPLLAFVALTALLGTGVILSGRGNREAIPSPLIGKPAPTFTLPTLHDPQRSVSLAELRGAPFLLNVWGSWCPECRNEHPYIERLSASGRIRVIGFNLKDEPEDAMRWLTQFGDPYDLIVADIDGAAALDWGVYGAPETFLVDAQGVVRWKYIGPMGPATIEDELKPELAKLGVLL